MRDRRFVNSLRPVFLFLLLGPFAAPLPSAGQDADAQPGASSDDRAGGIDEIIVTARRREESIQDVPVAITAITGDLEKATIRDLSDLNGYAPNVRIDEDTSRSNGVSIAIRGISPTRTDDNSFDAPVAVMIDNIYLGTLSGQSLENFDLERIEILRGPQGTLFGKNTVGGVINVIRSRPTIDWGIKAKAAVGSHDLREYRFVGNAPIIEDKLGAKLFFTSIKDNGIIQNTTLGRRVPVKDYMNYGLTLLWTPSEDFEAQLTVEQYKDDTEGGGSLTNYNLAAGVAQPPTNPSSQDLSGGLLGCTLYGTGLFPTYNKGVPCRTNLDTPNTVSGDLPNPSSFEVDAFTLNMHYDINENLRIVSTTGYRDMEEDRKLDFDGTSVDHITIERRNDFDQFSQELRLEGEFDTVSFVAGAYYWQSEFTQDWITGGDFWELTGTLGALPAPGMPPTTVGYNLATNTWLTFGPPPPAGLTPVQACLLGSALPNNPFGATRCDPGAGTGAYGPKIVQKLFETQETTSFALYAQADWEFVEDWTVTLGLRWTDEEKDFRAGQGYLAPLSRVNVDAFPAYANLENSWSELSPKFGLAWDFTEDVLFYFSYSEGFHSGGFFGVNQNIADFNRDQYDPEFATTYEVGAKAILLDGTLQLNFAYFYNEFEDKQESSVQVDPTTNTVATVFSNVADANYQGAELEANWVPSDYLSVWLSVGWLDAEYDSFETDINPNDALMMTQDASFLTPRNAPEWTAGVGFTLSYPIGPGDASFSGKYSWIDELETSLLNLPGGRLDSREDMQVSIGYRYENWTLNIFGRNLTDEFDEAPFVIFPLFASGTIAPRGRTYGVEITFEWGNE